MEKGMVLIYKKKKKAKMSLILESYLNKAMALEFLQVIRGSLLGECRGKPNPQDSATGAV